MVFFFVDDGLNGNGKAREAGLAAMGLWTMCGSYSGQHLTEGIVPEWYIRTFRSGMRHAGELVEARLWHAPGERCKSDICSAKKRPVPEGHFVFHDWAKVNTKTKATVEKERAANRERQKRFTERHSNAVNNDPQSNPSHSTKAMDRSSSSAATREAFAPVETAGDKSVLNTESVLLRLAQLTPDVALHPLHARMVAEHFLERASEYPKRPTAFVLSCITKHTDAVVNWIHTERWSE